MKVCNPADSWRTGIDFSRSCRQGCEGACGDAYELSCDDRIGAAREKLEWASAEAYAEAWAGRGRCGEMNVCGCVDGAHPDGGAAHVLLV